MALSAGNIINGTTVSQEDAWEVIEKLEHQESRHSGSVEIYSGQHPQYGGIHVVMPNIGDAVILFPYRTPLSFQD